MPRDLLRPASVAVRDLLRMPGYTLAIVVTLALAIGANSAIFSAVHTVLLTPSAIQKPDSLVICWERDVSRSPVIEVSYRNFQDWAAHSTSFSQAAAFGSSAWPAILDGRGEPVRLASVGVSASFFETLGVRPVLGRGFGSEDAAPNAGRVAVLSYKTWVTRFAADPGVIGTTVQLGEQHTVVGVMPAGFDFPHGADVWLPVVPILTHGGNGRVSSPLENVGVLFVVGRLRDGVTPMMASEELNRVANQLQQATHAPRFGTDVVVTPFLEYLIGPARDALWALFAAVSLLVLIACANVSGLMLTRASARRREDAIRLALGATPSRLGWPWAVEALILSVAGGAVGLVVSSWILRAIVSLAPPSVRLTTIALDPAAVAFTSLVALGTAGVCGVHPLVYSGRMNLVEALSDGARTTPGPRSLHGRSVLVLFQIGLAVVLLIGAGLVVRSVMNLRKIDLGFVPSDVLTLNVHPRGAKPSANEWMQELIARVSTLPRVDAAGAVLLRPLALGPIGAETPVILEGQPDSPQSARRNPTLSYQVATPGYFSAMRIGLVHGRLFTDQDTRTSFRVAIVSESTSRALWRGEDPIGRRILLPSNASDGGPRDVWRTVVGVVGDVRYRGLDDVRLDVYDAALQSDVTAGDLVVRTSGDPLAIASAVQREARDLDSRVVIAGVTTMDAIVSRAMAPWRFGVWMFMVFAGLAVALATVGLFSLISIDVTQRRHEFAIRLAVGAQPRDVRRSVVLSTIARVIPAVTLGIVAALLGTRALGHLLFGVRPLDPATYSAVILVVFAVVFAATWLPAHRAACADPLPILRGERL